MFAPEWSLNDPQSIANHDHSTLGKAGFDLKFPPQASPGA
jgi:hypothetical protein